MMGYLRDSFYRFKELLRRRRRIGAAELDAAQADLENRTPPEVEAIIVELLTGRFMSGSASPTSFASSAIRFRWPGCAGSGSVMISRR